MKTELTALEKTIWNLAMTGGRVQYNNGTTTIVSPNNLATVLVHSNKGKCKPILHSLNKLTETDDDYFYELNQQLCELLNVSSCFYFLKSLKQPNTYYALSYPKTVEVIEWFKQKHFNIENLNPDKFIEKSTLKL